jgi:hypothetical protein
VRVTTGQPTGDVPVVYLFGNSTVAGMEVADDSTLPSILQAQLGQGYRIVNKGMPGVYISGELLLLKRTKINQGDIVIFYDGVSDLADAVNSAQTRFESSPIMQPCLLLRHSSFGIGPLYCRWAKQQYNLENDRLALDADIVHSAKYYQNIVLKAKQYVEMNDGVFLHVIQATYHVRNPVGPERAI